MPEEDCGGEGGVGESKCRSSVPALSARHSPWNQLLIFIEIELVYSIILVLVVQYNDSAIIYITNCSPR